MRAVDTNVLVRLIARDDEKQTQAAETFVAKGAWVSHLVLTEALWVLRSVYGLDHQRIVRVVEVLLNHHQLTVQDGDTAALALKTLRHRPGLGFSDCLMLEVARRAGHLPLGTFDRGLARLDDTERL